MHSQLWRGDRATWGGRRRKQQLNSNHTMQRNVTCRLMDALYWLPVSFHAFPVVKGRWSNMRGEEGENSNLITITQCNAMSLADEWMHYTYSLSVFMHSQLWRGDRATWGRRRRKQQLNNNHTMQCNVTCRWMNAVYSHTVMFHAFPVVKGRTTWGGGRRKRQLNNNHTMQCNVTCRWMDALYSLPVSFHAFPVVKGR